MTDNKTEWYWLDKSQGVFTSNIRSAILKQGDYNKVHFVAVRAGGYDSYIVSAETNEGKGEVLEVITASQSHLEGEWYRIVSLVPLIADFSKNL